MHLIERYCRRSHWGFLMSMVQAASVIGDRYTRPALSRQGLQAAGREEPGDVCAPRIGANAALAGTSVHVQVGVDPETQILFLAAMTMTAANDCKSSFQAGRQVSKKHYERRQRNLGKMLLQK